MADKGNPARAVSVELATGDNNTMARLSLGGELDFETVSSALDKIEQQMGSHTQQHARQPLMVDLSRVTHCNSAALALLVEIRSIAQRQSTALQFVNIPAGVLQLAEVCEAQPLLQ